MRKFFLIPLMTCFTCVMAWGATFSVGEGGTYPATDAGLNQAIAAASAGDVIELTSDIAYATNGTGLINITKSITLDGQGHKITGYGLRDNLTGEGTNVFKTDYHRPTIAVTGAQVTIKDLAIYNTTNASYKENKTTYYSRGIGVMTFDGVNELIIDGCDISFQNKSNHIGLALYGTTADALSLSILNSRISGTESGYPIVPLKKINANINNSTLAGYSAMTFKCPLANNPANRWAQAFGTANYGPRGTVVNADGCTFDCPNTYKGESNNYAIFALEEDGVTLNLNNCSFNAKNIGSNNGQRLVNLQYNFRPNGSEGQDVYVNISGDNTHIYNIEAKDPNKLIWNGWVVGENAPAASEGLSNQILSDIKVRITGGTLTIDPRQVRWITKADNMPKSTSAGTYVNQSSGSGAIEIPSTHEVREVNQGSETVYRVVPKTTTLYDLNDNVQSQGNGQNPATSFDLKTGTDMILNQATTKAGYVEVSNATKVTVANNQTLVINNGLDVQGASVVTAKPGSALVIGKGGIVTEASANIVVEANQNGAASLLLDPAITVNQTPELTVKMVAHNVGKIGEDYFWHRFALPIDQVRADDGSWSKDGHSYGTLLYKWDYTNNKWASLQELDEMKPFYGYTLSLEEVVANPDALKDAGYIFKGNLTGNVNSILEFSRQGYNFFGNSYTGYISVLKLVDELIGNADIDGTVWMWNSDEQQYEDVPLNDLRNNPNAARYTGVNAWRAEVAPMQTFILRLMTENTDATAKINYATAVWGNPRYDAVTGANNAPARRVASTNDAYVRIIVTDANGKKDAVKFYEDANLSDAYDKGFDGAKYMNERTVNVYATVNGENYGTVATDNIEGKMLTICTTDEIAYTISFADVEGNEYALRDNATNQIIAIEEGATYEFAAQPNSTVEGRFQIINRFDAPTAIENTEIKANVKGIYSITGMYLGEDFEALPAGVYVVNGVKIVK